MQIMQKYNNISLIMIHILYMFFHFSCRDMKFHINSVCLDVHVSLLTKLYSSHCKFSHVHPLDSRHTCSGNRSVLRR